MTYPFRKTKYCRQHALVTLTYSRKVTGDSKGAKAVTSGVSIYYLRHLIKPQIVY